jgi:hypothetical protein
MLLWITCLVGENLPHMELKMLEVIMLQLSSPLVTREYTLMANGDARWQLDAVALCMCDYLTSPFCKSCTPVTSSLGSKCHQHDLDKK